MPDIATPQVVVFANTRARVLADAADSFYQTCKRFQQEWAAALAAGVTFPNTTDLVADGSDVDGRKRVQGAQLNGLKTLADSMVTYFETGTPSRIAQIQQMSVNGLARF
jgi:hypothetical protein